MSTIFSKIISGEIPCYKVAENKNFLAFLDINPNSVGHTLCIPKKEVDNVLDLDEVSFIELMMFSRKVAKSIRNVIKCEKVAFSVIGLEVPHVHFPCRCQRATSCQTSFYFQQSLSSLHFSQWDLEISF